MKVVDHQTLVLAQALRLLAFHMEQVIRLVKFDPESIAEVKIIRKDICDLIDNIGKKDAYDEV